VRGARARPSQPTRGRTQNPDNSSGRTWYAAGVVAHAPRHSATAVPTTVARMSDPLSQNRFQSAYDGTPPWDIGRPQAAFVALERRATVQSPVLDVGCGTGENALFFASRGYEVLGVDIVERAIDKARAKSSERGIAATFQVADALSLETLGKTFSSVIDSGVFHVFDGDARKRYVASLARVLRPGCHYFMLVFSDREPADWGGPHRIRRDEIETAFADGWRIRSIDAVRFETNFHPEGGHGWFADIERT
jgi:SAM-dependent methyltransferase